MSFGREVNEYLNHYVTVADAKAAVIFAGSIALVSASFDMRPEDRNTILSGVSLFFTLCSLLISAIAIFPRMPKSSSTLIFWGDIREFRTAEAYFEKVEKLNEKEIDRQYAIQNYLVSGVLVEKNRMIKYSFIVLSVGILFFLLDAAK